MQQVNLETDLTETATFIQQAQSVCDTNTDTNKPSTSTPNHDPLPDDDHPADHIDEAKQQQNESHIGSNEDPDDSDHIQIVANNSEKVEKIIALLSQIKPTKEFAVCGKATELPANPDIYIKEVGRLNLPLSDVHIDNLSDLCSTQQSESFVDKAIMECFELDASELELRNPQWNKQVGALAKRVCADMSLSGENMEPRLAKLVLYKEGGHFLKHSDTNRAQNSFATLHIQLPSIYTGGKLAVYGRGTTKRIFDFGQKSGEAKHSIHYVAHQDDLEYEVLEVTAGYRLTLIYALCRLSDETGIYCKDTKTAREMCAALQDLYRAGDHYNMAMLLESAYDSASFHDLGTSGLKALDDERFNLLKSANYYLPEQDKFNFYIAHVHLYKLKGVFCFCLIFGTPKKLKYDFHTYSG